MKLSQSQQLNVIALRLEKEPRGKCGRKILSSLDSPNRSNLHRMIRIYGFLKYGQNIRELIINTVVHRSYLDHGTIQVAVYDNRHSKNYWQSKESRTERTGVYWRSG